MSPMIRVGASRSVGVTELPAKMVDAAVSLARLESFCGALGRKLGLRAVPLQARTYAELAALVDSGEVDFAWLPPWVALRALQRGRAAPLLAPVRRGETSFVAALFVPESSPLWVLEDLRQARVAWVDRTSAAGYIAVRAALRAEGTDLLALFGRETFEGSHQAVVQAVMGGTADVGATYVHRASDGSLLQAGWGPARARSIFEHGPIPADVFSASAQVAQVIVTAVTRALSSEIDPELGRAARELFEAERLEPIPETHLAPLERLIAHLDE